MEETPVKGGPLKGAYIARKMVTRLIFVGISTLKRGIIEIRTLLEGGGMTDERIKKIAEQIKSL